MKIIAKIPDRYSPTSDRFIVEATADELARIAGWYSAYIHDADAKRGRMPIDIGHEVLVNDRWKHWEAIERNRSELRAAAKLMETTAALLRTDVLGFMEPAADRNQAQEASSRG